MASEDQLAAAQDAIGLLKERLATVQDKYNCILVRFSEISESNTSAAQERLAVTTSPRTLGRESDNRKNRKKQR